MLNKLDRDFGFWGLLRFALPSIVMMVFMSLYTVVDGFFIARFVGPDALSATNIIYPVINVVLAAGIMLATGGSALVARRMGEGDERGARESFTFLMLCGAGIGVAFALVGLFLPEPLSRLLGASDRLIVYSVDYLRILLLFAPAYMLQLMFQSFFVAAGKPGDGRAAWDIAVSHPDGGVLCVVPVADGCAVTSGGSQRYFTVDGVRYHHIIDPDTLYPANLYRQTTVFCADSALADWLSTSAFLLEYEDSRALVESMGAKGIWILPDGEVRASDGLLPNE